MNHNIEAQLNNIVNAVEGLRKELRNVGSSPEKGITFKNSDYPGSRSVYVLEDGKRIGRIRRRGGSARPPSDGGVVGFSWGEGGQTISPKNMAVILDRMEDLAAEEEDDRDDDDDE